MHSFYCTHIRIKIKYKSYLRVPNISIIYGSFSHSFLGNAKFNHIMRFYYTSSRKGV